VTPCGPELNNVITALVEIYGFVPLIVVN
jgi:hypothetical protein